MTLTKEASDRLALLRAPPKTLRPGKCPKGTKREKRTPNDELIDVRCINAEGSRHGPYLLRYRDGRPAISGTWDDGSEVGTWRWWSVSGRLVQTENYDEEETP